MIFELFRLEMPGFRFDDVRCQLHHVLRNFLILDVAEVLVFLAHFIRISQRHPEQALAARFERDDVLARGEDHPGERHHAFLADRLANDRERLLAHFPVGHDVVRAVQIELVDFFLGHELVDLDRALALDGGGLELFRLDLDVFAFTDLVALDDVGRIHLLVGLGVDLAVFDAVAGVSIDLMKADFLALAGRGEQCDRTRDERKLQVAFPIRARGHDPTPYT